jgi:hypothetical protein
LYGSRRSNADQILPRRANPAIVATAGNANHLRDFDRWQFNERAAPQAAPLNDSIWKILPLTVPAARRFRRLRACWEDSLSRPDRRKDHSFFGRAIAVIGGMILPLDVRRGQDDHAPAGQ